MLMEDTLNGNQPHSGSFKIAGLMQTLKHTEEFSRVFHVEPHSVIANEVDSFLTEDLLSGMDIDSIARPAVLEGVRKQVYEHLPDQAGIAFNASQVVDLPFDLARPTLGLEIVEDGGHQVVQRR